MRKKLAVILAATLALGSISFPAYAEDADYDSVEWEVVGEAYDEGEDEGSYEDGIGAGEDTDEPEINVDAEGEDQDAEWLAGDGFGVEEADEDLIGEGEGEGNTQDTKIMPPYRWAYENGEIVAYVGDARVTPESYEIHPANRKDEAGSYWSTYTTAESELYLDILEDENSTQVEPDFIESEVENWQSYVTGASFKYNGIEVTSRAFYLYDAVINGDEEVDSYLDLPSVSYMDYTVTPTCVNPGTADIYTFFLVPEAEGRYEEGEIPYPSDVVNIVVERDIPVEPDTDNHKWKKIVWKFKDIFNTKENADGSVSLVDEEYPGWYAYVCENECSLCHDKRTLVQRTYSTKWLLDEVVEKFSYIEYKNNECGPLDWMDEDYEYWYSYYIPAAKADVTQGWAREFKNIVSFKTVDGKTTIGVEFDEDGDGTSLYYLSGEEGEDYGIDDSMFEEGFYRYTKAGKAINTNDLTFVLIDCAKDGSYVQYTGRSASEVKRDDSSQKIVTVGKHHTSYGKVKLIYAADMPYVLVRASNGDILWQPNWDPEGEEAVYNYKQYAVKAVSKQYDDQYIRYELDEEPAEWAEPLGYIFPTTAKVYNMVCNRHIFVHTIDRCGCLKHMYSTDALEVWDEIGRTSEEIALGDHLYNQPVAAAKYDEDAEDPEDPWVAMPDTLYNVMVGLRDGGYITREPVDALDWQSYREFYPNAHYPAISKYVAYYDYVDELGNVEHRRCDITGVNDDEGLLGQKLITMTADNSTCTENGEVTIAFQCARGCGYCDDTVVPVLAHGPIEEAIPVQVGKSDPTCYSEGEEMLAYRCLVCGRVLREEVRKIKKLAHEYLPSVAEYSGDVVVAREDRWNVTFEGEICISEHEVLKRAAELYKEGTKVNLLVLDNIYNVLNQYRVGISDSELHVNWTATKYCKNYDKCGEKTSVPLDFKALYVKALTVNDRTGGSITLVGVAGNNKEVEKTFAYYSGRTAYLDRVNPATHIHNWVLDESQHVDPTSTTPGKDVYVCTICGATYEEVLPVLKNGIAYDTDGRQKLFKDGVVQTDFTGMYSQDGEKYFVNKGIVPADLDGMANAPDGKFYYFKDGRVDKTATNIAPYGGTWFYIKNGEFDSTFNGIVDYDGTKFVFFNGTLCKDAEGLWQYPGTNDWYYMSGGWIHTEINGLALYDGALFYLKNGKVDWTFNGKAVYNGAVFDVVNGAVYL